MFRRKPSWQKHWVVETWQWSQIRQRHAEFVGAVWPAGISEEDLMSRQDPGAWGWDILWVALPGDLEETRKILAVLGQDRELWSSMGNRLVYTSLLGLPVEVGGRGSGTQDWRTTPQAARIIAEAWAAYLWSKQADDPSDSSNTATTVESYVLVGRDEVSGGEHFVRGEDGEPFQGTPGQIRAFFNKYFADIEREPRTYAVVAKRLTSDGPSEIEIGRGSK